MIGNLACIGLLYMALWLKTGARPYLGYFSVLLLLNCSALLAFSKAGWFMLAVGNFLLLALAFKPNYCNTRKGYLAAIAAVTVFSAGNLVQLDKVICFMHLKIISSAPSLEIRKNFAVSTWNIIAENPAGIGVGRYVEYVTGAPVSEQEAAQVGYSSAGNPHSAILYLMVTGGWGAFLSLLLLLGAVANNFGAMVAKPTSRRWYAVSFALFGLILFISASYQLQILTQNFLYVLAGILLAAGPESSKLKSNIVETAVPPCNNSLVTCNIRNQ